jgi:hypothetical protein
MHHPGIILNDPTGVLARVGMARGYAMEGETAKARSAYQTSLPSGKTPTPTFHSEGSQGGVREAELACESWLANDSCESVTFHVWGIAVECELEPSLSMQTYRRHDNPKYAMSEYESQEGGHRRRLPCWFAAKFQKDRQMKA